MSRKGVIVVLFVILAVLILLIWKKNQEFSLEALVQESSQIEISEVTDTDLISEQNLEEESGIEILEGNYTEYSQEYEFVKESVETLSYTVRRGDTLYRIAHVYKTSVNALRYNNPQLKGRNGVTQGEVLTILKNNVISYKVSSGESLFSIAKKFGSTVETIQDLNHLNGSEINKGDSIYIPIENQSILKIFGVEPLTTTIQKKIVQTIIPKVTNKSATNIKQLMGSKTFWPVEWLGVTSNYGIRFHPVLNRYVKHKGVDLRARVGDKVRAFNSGTVTFTGYMDGYGNLVVISHSGGLETRYGHLNSILVQNGSVVKKGMVIGTAGATGRVTGPHLHFEVRMNGREIDPTKYLKSSVTT